MTKRIFGSAVTVNGDGKADLVVSDADDNELLILFAK